MGYHISFAFEHQNLPKKKRVSTRCFFLTHFFFRQLLFFGPMSFKLAVTLQKDAPGDTDHGERLSGQKY